MKFITTEQTSACLYSERLITMSHPLEYLYFERPLNNIYRPQRRTNHGGTLYRCGSRFESRELSKPVCPGSQYLRTFSLQLDGETVEGRLFTICKQWRSACRACVDGPRLSLSQTNWTGRWGRVELGLKHGLAVLVALSWSGSPQAFETDNIRN